MLLRVFGAFAGDFTAILKQKEKMGSRPLSSKSMCRFQSLVDDLGLIDLGYSRILLYKKIIKLVEETFKRDMI